MNKHLVPGYGYMSSAEVRRWNSMGAKTLIHWHRFLGRLESIIGRYDPSLDFVRNPVWDTQRDFEQEDREYVMELCGNRAPLGLDIIDDEVALDMRERKVDRPGPGIDKVSVLEPEEVLDTACLRHGQQAAALRDLAGGTVLCKSYSSGSSVPLQQDDDALGWLMAHQREFVSATDEAWMYAQRMAARVSFGDGASYNQTCWDEERGRDWSVSNPFCDRVWRWFEACGERVALPRYKHPKTGRLTQHDLHASANGREYDRMHYDVREHRSRGTRGAYTGPNLPRRCFDRWIDWPDMCVFGDVKDAARKWLMDALEGGVQVYKRHTLLAGRRLRPAPGGAAVIQIPRGVWRLIMQDSHPELHAMLVALERQVLGTCARDEDTERTAWRRITFNYVSSKQALEALLGVKSVIKLRRYIALVEDSPGLVFSGRPLDSIAIQCRDYRIFLNTMDEVYSALPFKETASCLA